MFQVATPHVVLAGHAALVRCLALSPDGLQAVSGGDDNHVILWDLPGKRLRNQHAEHARGVTRVRFQPKAASVISGDVGGAIFEWDLRNRVVAVAANAFKGEIPSGSIAVQLPNRLILGAEGNDLVLRRTDRRGELARFRGHTKPVLCVTASPNGKVVISGGMDESVRVWDVANGRETRAALWGHNCPITAVAVSENGKMALSAGRDHRIMLWEM